MPLPTKFKLPNRKQVGGELLDLNYGAYWDQMMSKMMIDADIYGWTAYGDGATIKRMPFMNFLASSIHMFTEILHQVSLPTRRRSSLLRLSSSNSSRAVSTSSLGASNHSI